METNYKPYESVKLSQSCIFNKDIYVCSVANSNSEDCQEKFKDLIGTLKTCKGIQADEVLGDVSNEEICPNNVMGDGKFNIKDLSVTSSRKCERENRNVELILNGTHSVVVNRLNNSQETADDTQNLESGEIALSTLEVHHELELKSRRESSKHSDRESEEEEEEDDRESEEEEEEDTSDFDEETSDKKTEESIEKLSDSDSDESSRSSDDVDSDEETSKNDSDDGEDLENDSGDDYEGNDGNEADSGGESDCSDGEVDSDVAGNDDDDNDSGADGGNNSGDGGNDGGNSGGFGGNVEENSGGDGGNVEENSGGDGGNVEKNSGGHGGNDGRNSGERGDNDDDDDKDGNENETTADGNTDQDSNIRPDNLEWKILKEFGRYTSCPRCSEFYSSENLPNLLLCGHNICDECHKNKKKNKNKCDICNKAFSENFSPNTDLMDLIDYIPSNRLGAEKVTKDFVESRNTFYNLMAETTNLTDELFLTPFMKMEKDLDARMNLMSFMYNVHKEGDLKLKNFEASHQELLNNFSAAKTLLLKSNSFSEMTTNLPLVEKHLEKAEKLKGSSTLIHEDVNEIFYQIKNLLNKNKRKPETLEFLRKKLSGKSFNCCLSTKCGDEPAPARYARLEYDVSFLLHTFTTNIPHGFSLVFSFEDMKNDFLKEQKTLFMDIVHTVDGCGINPNRIFAKFEENRKIRPILLTLIGLTSNWPLGIDIEDSQNYLSIKCSQFGEDIFNDDFVKSLAYKSMKPKAGHIVISLSDDSIIKIMKNDAEGKKEGEYCVIGRVTGRIRELEKIKGKCYLQNCGLLVAE